MKRAVIASVLAGVVSIAACTKKDTAESLNLNKDTTSLFKTQSDPAPATPPTSSGPLAGLGAGLTPPSAPATPEAPKSVAVAKMHHKKKIRKHRKHRKHGHHRKGKKHRKHARRHKY